MTQELVTPFISGWATASSTTLRKRRTRSRRTTRFPTPWSAADAAVARPRGRAAYVRGFDDGRVWLVWADQS